LSMVSLLPSAPGWDSAIAKREAKALEYGQRTRAKFGEELTKTSPDAPFEERDVWQYFSRGMGGLIAWHRRCETQAEEDPEYHLLISPPVAGTFNLRCAVADMMTPFQAIRLRKSGPPGMQDSIIEGERQQVTATVARDPAGTVGIDMPSAGEVDMSLNNFWDDQSWQAMLEEFSMFPTAEGFQLG
jgi:hypothetical protein